jgi:hypothetical protein
MIANSEQPPLQFSGFRKADRQMPGIDPSRKALHLLVLQRGIYGTKHPLKAAQVYGKFTIWFVLASSSDLRAAQRINLGLPECGDE